MLLRWGGLQLALGFLPQSFASGFSALRILSMRIGCRHWQNTLALFGSRLDAETEVREHVPQRHPGPDGVHKVRLVAVSSAIRCQGSPSSWALAKAPCTRHTAAAGFRNLNPEINISMLWSFRLVQCTSEPWFLGARPSRRISEIAEAGRAKRTLWTLSVSARVPAELRPIYLLRLSLLRFLDSNFLGNSLWT